MKEHEFSQTHLTYPSIRMDVETSTAYLRALIEDSPIAIVGLDAQHRYVMSNPAFQKLFQYTPKELLSHDLDSLIAGPEQVEEAMRLSRCVLKGIKVHTVTQRRRRDGMMIDVEVYGIPLIVEGELAGVYALYQDVTERNRALTALREISNQIDTLQQEERRRIARDLHDSTSQELTALNWNLTRIGKLVREGDDTLKALIQETKDIAFQCSARIRTATYLLHPPLLGESGLVQAVPWLAQGFEQRSGIRVLLEMDENLGRFRDDVENAIFRVLQEGLANVLRHSGSPIVRICLHNSDGWLRLELNDEGKNPARDALINENVGRTGVGISGMRERLQQLGGCLRIDCTEAGTAVIAMLPVEGFVHG